ncbi:hypothetical protein [Helicobacter mustelae]|uniref:hypothetical protein n=1 Tax=Helicobacter mustelae TaxID=217 RepID=UPI000324E0B3|nr:hypothetical protein [Helicobacter mustelae]
MRRVKGLVGLRNAANLGIWKEIARGVSLEFLWSVVDFWDLAGGQKNRTPQ